MEKIDQNFKIRQTTDSTTSVTGLAEQLEDVSPGATVFVLAEGLPSDTLRVTFFSVRDDLLIASTQSSVDGAPSGSRIVFNLNEVTAVITT